ncbi:DUF3445 domain-containing protein [Lutimaribacter sp. EGI FJ00015]|uniref:DUF3445 domain-containing protein n=1 Tax=Lutimaribacter degradans TaxID=2945989 RepID=A0ACC5ZTX3_9RHOB|nr:DUF3445 domain-containing protein [Lutimaribacter sp. EGI FJ00013]MCM2560994.1 DUF3445 domain-containing protein [Lutimaribacter sp. EGI FJ00013]MCO0612059.1 DUF3445 domain-containing protein [Lutimaribacter sp. EGI FJ00015]MCO0634821.1 DUF3445 domain-containing protein [Lutimaribacter sp. EGI FJ00014]
MILNSHIPHEMPPKPLPGVAPLSPDEWIIVDDAFDAQMAERARLLRTRRAEVLALDDSARPAADELLEVVLGLLAARADYTVGASRVTRPDGVEVPINRADPLGTLGMLVQQDFCLMQKPEGQDEHLLTGAVLCFPSSWKLSEKFMRPLVAIHQPVAVYDDNIARRVQRLFDGIRPGRPLWRCNALNYDDPALFQPRSANDRRAERHSADAKFLRSERQSLWRLDETRAVVFGIHTIVVAR